MPDDKDPATADAARVQDAADGGWSMESHSAPTDPPPMDTTLVPTGIDNPPQDEAVAKPAEESASADGDEPPADTGELSESADTVAARSRDAAGKFTKPPAKKKESAQERIDAIRRQAGDAERRAEAAERRAQDLATRMEALEKGTTKPAAEPKPPTAEERAALAAAEPPDPPNAMDFDSTEDLQKARTQWKKDMLAWQTARETGLKSEITESFEQRTTREREEVGRREAGQQAEARRQAMVTAHPDFAAKVTANAAALEEAKNPFILDITSNTEDGFELLYDLVSSPDDLLALGALPLPSRPLADAVRVSPASRALMKHFATDDGREDFMRLRMLPAARVGAELGRLEVSLESADRGPAPTARPISNAAPPAKPPVGTPRARDGQGGSGTDPAKQPFEDWMAAEDKREKDERLKAAGIAV